MQTIIAKRSDMMVMSNEGPLGAYVNPGGLVFEIMTLHKAHGLALLGRAETQYSWFPGYVSVHSFFSLKFCKYIKAVFGWGENKF